MAKSAFRLRWLRSLLKKGCLIVVLLLACVQPAAGSPPIEARQQDSCSPAPEPSYRKLEPGELRGGLASIQPQSVSGLLLKEDFEGANPLAEWQLLDRSQDGEDITWGVDENTPHSGTISAWPAAGGINGIDPSSFAYPGNLDSWLISAPLNLTNVSRAELKFYYNNQSEANADYFAWYASIDGENFYGQQVSGDSCGWQEITFSLTAVPTLGDLSGQPALWIAFVFTSDEPGEDEFYEGVFLDDITLQGYFASGINLLPATPLGWDRPIVPSQEKGATATGTLYALQPTYINWAFLNEGDAVAGPFHTCLYLDNKKLNDWQIGPVEAGQTYTFLDYQVAGDISADTHTLKLWLDCDQQVKETNEEDNIFTYEFNWEAPPKPNLVPFKPTGWSDPVVPSNSMNVTTLTKLKSAGKTYINWTIRNIGSDISTNFDVDFFFDGVRITNTSALIQCSEDYPFRPGDIFIYKNHDLTFSPPPGLHTLKLVIDPDNVIDELNEEDNVFQKDFTWEGVCVDVGVAVDPPDGGTASISGTKCPEDQYVNESQITLLAQPNPNFGFDHWSGTATSTNNPFSYKITDSSTFTAHFVQCFTLTHSSDPPAAGQVDTQPSPNCGSQYKTGTRVNLSPTPNRGYGFVQWIGPVSVDENGPYVIMDADKAVTARFMNLPAIPVLLSPANNASVPSLQPTFTWKSSGTDLLYDLELASNPDFNSAVHISGIAALTYTVETTLEPLQTYYWRVRAVNSGKLSSDWSAARIFKTLSANPILLSPADGSDLLTLRTELAWQPVSGALTYTLQLSTSSAFSSVFMTRTTKQPIYTITSDLRYRNRDIFWRVRANQGRTAGAWSDTWRFHTPDPPGVPGLQKPANGSLTTDDTPLLDWADVSASAGFPFKEYQVQFSQFADFSTSLIDQSTAGSFLQIDDSLPPNTRWFWHVRSVNDRGQMSAWSKVYSFRTSLLPPGLLSPPDGMQLTNNRPRFEWESVEGASSSSLQISVDPDFRKIWHTWSSRTGQLLPPTDLPPSRMLYWRVRSNGTNGPSLWSAGRWLTTANPPSAPVLLSPANNALLLDNNTPALIWRAARFPVATALKHYQVMIALDPEFSDSQSFYTTDLSFTLTDPLPANTRFYWRVRAYNLVDEYSNWSAVRSLRTALAAPLLVSPVSGSSTTASQPFFEWQPVAGASGYTIQVSTLDTFRTLKAIGSPKNPAWLCSRRLSPGTYFWRVRATGANGPGNWSEIRLLTIAAP